jgi:hypothetical protein
VSGRGTTVELGLTVHDHRRLLDIGPEEREHVWVRTAAGEAGFSISRRQNAYWGSVRVPFGARIDIGPYEEAHEPLGPFETREEALFFVARRLSVCLALVS